MCCVPTGLHKPKHSWRKSGRLAESLMWRPSRPLRPLICMMWLMESAGSVAWVGAQTHQAFHFAFISQHSSPTLLVRAHYRHRPAPVTIHSITLSFSGEPACISPANSTTAISSPASGFHPIHGFPRSLPYTRLVARTQLIVAVHITDVAALCS